MNSTHEEYANHDEDFASHIPPLSAKRRRLEGTLENSAATWNRNNTASSWLNSELGRNGTGSGQVVSHFDMNIDPLAPKTTSQPRALFPSEPYLLYQDNNDVYTEVQDFDQKFIPSSSFIAPYSGPPTMVAGTGWDTALAAHSGPLTCHTDWNMRGQLGQPEIIPNISWQQAYHGSYTSLPYGELDSSHLARAQSHGVNATQWSLPIEPNTLHAELSSHSEMVFASQENSIANFRPDLSCRKYGPTAQVEAPSKVDENESVCFGMVADISGECQLPPSGYPQSSTSSYPVKFDTALQFSSLSDAELNGTILKRRGQLLQSLLDESSLRLQVTCVLGDRKKENGKTRGFLPHMVPCALLITLYGPLSLCEELGEFFQDYDIYLQDPRGCDMEVRYCNPHRLSSIDLPSCPMTSELSSQDAPLGTCNLTEVPKQLDLFTIIDSQRDLPEAPQPDVIQTSLERHQKQALSFMLQREKGWAQNGRDPDLWEMKKISYGYRFINRISNAYQTEEPPQFRGGIIADPMGLGKTLSMIALIATDLGNRLHVSAESGVSNGKTLVIVPPAVLESWEEQLSQHVVKSALAWGRHHGKSRLTKLSELESFNLVLTTYHTVSAEWRNGKQAEKSVMFCTKWRRVILDEAHLIRNSGSQISKAICSLLADSRWAVTGTPIQNRLGDLTALLKFLQVYPYNDATRFDTDFTNLCKIGEVEEAVKRLKRLSGCLLLRRPKETIDLPSRRDLRCVVDFSHDERALYDEIKNRVITDFQVTSIEGTDGSNSAAFVNIIQQINSLRMICNMGLQYHSRYDNNITDARPQGQHTWSEVAQQTFEFQCEAESIMCHVCQSSLGLAETLFGEQHTHPRFSECLRFICSECSHRLHKSSKPISCGHSPSHPIALVSTSRKDVEEAPASSVFMDDFQTSLIGIPSKVTSLVTQLQVQPADVKSLVFSSWRMTLDVVEAGLKQAHINYLRFDGKVSQKNRQAILEKFRKDPTIKVMILTLSCGAVGLTLTEASCAYLMEPHWNPTIEEQALARIHRIGQKKEVTTVRFFVKDTFEERVIEIQESKKDLASVLFSPHKESTAGDVGRLEWLCNLL